MLQHCFAVKLRKGFVNYKTSPDFQSAWEVMFLKSRMGPASCTVFFPKAHHRCIWIRNIRFFFFYTNIIINNGSGFGLSAVMTECCHAKLKHNILLQLAWGTALAQVMANLVTAQACHRAPTLQDGGSLSAGWFVPKTRPAKASQHRSYPTTTFLCSRSNVSRYLYITSVWWFFFFYRQLCFSKISPFSERVRMRGHFLWHNPDRNVKVSPHTHLLTKKHTTPQLTSLSLASAPVFCGSCLETMSQLDAHLRLASVYKCLGLLHLFFFFFTLELGQCYTVTIRLWESFKIFAHLLPCGCT